MERNKRWMPIDFCNLLSFVAGILDKYLDEERRNHKNEENAVSKYKC